MARQLDPKFKLTEAPPSDMDEMWALCEEAYASDAIWKVVFKDCPKEQIHPWIMSIFPHRWSLPDITFYKITELATGCGHPFAIYLKGKAKFMTGGLQDGLRSNFNGPIAP